MKKILALAVLGILCAHAVHAEGTIAPTPRSSPRTPVNRQELADRKAGIPSSHILDGQATVIDTERLRIGDVDMRLFGVVPPQLSATFGPQARAVLDKLVTGQTTSCYIRDRDQSGRFLATCHANNADLAVELLRRGLAVTARGSLGSTDLVTPYMAAEQAAQTQKIGLWSMNVPPAVSVLEPVMKPEPTASVSLPPAPVVVPTPAPAPSPMIIDVKKDDKKLDVKKPDDALAKIAVLPMTASSLAPQADDMLAMPMPAGNIFTRYQLLLTGILMLATALSILFVISAQRRREHREEMKAIAAAFRGELMAARAVCQARLKTAITEAEDKAMAWPRIRATLYQAYVGRLGWLGAELARQVASIYGQSSDYTAYYQAGDDTRTDTTPKRHALQTLVKHIEEVLPKLAMIEQTGKRLDGSLSVFPRNYSYERPVERPSAIAPPQEKSAVKTSEKNMAAAVGPVTPPAISAMINSVSEVVKEEKPAATEVTEINPPKSTKPPLWHSVRQFARDRLKPPAKPAATTEEQDYAAMIEEEMANMSFGESEDDFDLTPTNVTKIRNIGS